MEATIPFTDMVFSLDPPVTKGTPMTTCFDSLHRDFHGKVGGLVEVVLSYYRDRPHLGCPERHLLHVRRWFLAGAWRRLSWVERASQGLCQTAGPSQTHQGSSLTQSCLVQSRRSGARSKCSSSQVCSPVEKREQLEASVAPLSSPPCRLCPRCCVSQSWTFQKAPIWMCLNWFLPRCMKIWSCSWRFRTRGMWAVRKKKVMPPCRQNFLVVFLEKTRGPIAWFYASLSSFPPCCIWFPWNSGAFVYGFAHFFIEYEQSHSFWFLFHLTLLVPSSESTAKPRLGLESVTVFVAIRPVFSPHCFPKLCTSGKFSMPFFIVPSLTRQRAVIIGFRLVWLDQRKEVVEISIDLNLQTLAAIWLISWSSIMPLAVTIWYSPNVKKVVDGDETTNKTRGHDLCNIQEDKKWDWNLKAMSVCP